MIYFSDSRIWIFTADAARVASDEMLAVFDDQVAQKVALEMETKAKQVRCLIFN